MSSFATSSVQMRRRAMTIAARTIVQTIQNMAIQDYAILGFHFFVWGRAIMAPESLDAVIARETAATILCMAIVTLLLTRGELVQSRRIRAIVYRGGVFIPMLLSYFELRHFLPALQPHLLDEELLRIDEFLFGVTPAVWLGQFNHRPIVEWFAFFYYGYFVILIAMFFPPLLWEKGVRQAKFLFGATLIVTVGHAMYTFVPGRGPHATIPFDQELQGGFWWGLVCSAVGRAGAHLDIFPSLHTAYPAYFALHAFDHRHDPVYEWAWPIIAFIALNAIVASVFLRWHWGIDIIAGLVLALLARRLGTRVALREASRGEGDDARQPVWEPF